MKKLIVLLFSIVTFAFRAYAILLINQEEPVYYFVNHEEQISELRKKLLTDKIVGITGITGMGKSEMVRKYVQEYKQDYEIIAFLDASIDLTSQFITIAKEINQQICTKTSCYIAEDPKNVKTSLMTYLKPKDKWLLIFDNLHINENEKIKDIIEWHHNGHIIICSQDSKYLLSKISVPYLKDEHAIVIINKIMEEPPREFVKELVQSLKGYPTDLISHSAIFLQNNNHMSIKEYINYIQKHDNKIKAYLDAVLREITPQGKDLLYDIALLNNQRVSKHLLTRLVDNNNNLSEVINELIRFGLVEQLSENRNKQVFRMHDAIKEELLKTCNLTTNRKNIDNLLTKLLNLMSGEMVNQFYLIMQDDTFESNLEILLSNADKYDSNIYAIMALKNSLLGYYLRSREPYNAKKIVDWFKEHEPNLNYHNMSEQEKVIYSRSLGRIGRYEYFIVNHHPDIAMQYLSKAKSVIDKLPRNEGAKVAIYFEIFQIQVFTGNIVEAENNLNTIEKIMTNNQSLIHKISMIDYGKARILLAKGEYQKALLAIIEMINKEKFQLNKSRSLLQLSDAELKQENAWLAPIYTLQVEILNYMQNFTEAYKIASSVYNKIKSDITGDITSATLAYNLTELSRSELGLGKKDCALNHAIEAINILLKDESRGNKENELDDSIDVFLSSALVAKADALRAMGKIQEAMDTYTLAKHIYWNVYGIKNIGNMDNVGYAFVQAAKTAVNLPDKHDSHIQCFYFYSLLRDYFGANHPRSKEVQGICRAV